MTGVQTCASSDLSGLSKVTLREVDLLPLDRKGEVTVLLNNTIDVIDEERLRHGFTGILPANRRAARKRQDMIRVTRRGIGYRKEARPSYR